ncbi:hypothetical protein E2C01_062162 [Portunus trituberculatus]|uniref:Uncharacterized protein n=1 Tax=Portunus trituberculatus TaxID=210409 RepID=A0A5B7HCW2_PORTR|nr:hypothetical protein [Portunus trituberculatus]
MRSRLSVVAARSASLRRGFVTQ